MDYTLLGDTDLNISTICFGTWAFAGHWGEFSEKEAIAAIRKGHELGINFFDTAQAYGFGRAEKLLGKALRDELMGDRADIVLATKGGLRPNGDRLLRDASPEWLRQGLEESLEHLDTDYVDIYQVHWPDSSTPAEETARVLDEFVDEGKVRYVGVSNYDAEQMAAFEQFRSLDSLQPPYHMFRRDIEGEILPYCDRNGIGVFVYGPLAHGLLTGKYDEETTFPEDDWRSGSAIFQGETYRRNLRVVDKLTAFARKRGWTLPQLAVAWALSHPVVDAAIVGARRPDQIAETARAAAITLTKDDRTEIDAILTEAVPVGGPTPEGV